MDKWRQVLSWDVVQFEVVKEAEVPRRFRTGTARVAVITLLYQDLVDKLDLPEYCGHWTLDKTTVHWYVRDTAHEYYYEIGDYKRDEHIDDAASWHIWAPGIGPEGMLDNLIEYLGATRES